MLLLPLGLWAQTYTVYLSKKPLMTYHSSPDCPRIMGKVEEKVIVFPDVLSTKDKRIVENFYACNKCNPIHLSSLKNGNTTISQTPLSYDDNNDIIIKPIQTISSSTVEENDVKQLFEVVNAPDKTLIGCPVVCKVVQVRKSNMSGSEGRMIIRPLYINKDGEKIDVIDDIHLIGTNCCNPKIYLFFIPPLWFIPGGGARAYTFNRYTIRLK